MYAVFSEGDVSLAIHSPHGAANYHNSSAFEWPLKC